MSANRTINRMKTEKAEMFDLLLSFQKSIERVQEKNHTALLRILEELTAIRKDIKEISRAMACEQEMPLLPKSPMNYDEFVDFEQQIEDDIDKYCRLKSNLKKISTSKNKNYVTKVWRTLITDEVAEQFSWRGTENKKCVRNLNVTSAIRYVFVNENGGDEKDFVAATKSFFQFAKNRRLIKSSKQHKKNPLKGEMEVEVSYINEF